MPWVDTPALNPPVILIEYSRTDRREYTCTENETKGCSLGTLKKDKEIQSVCKREECRGMQNAEVHLTDTCTRE